MTTLKLNSRNKRAGKKSTLAATNGTPIKLDIGCGPNKKAGFFGIDRIAFPGVDAICDLARTDLAKWYFEKDKLPGLIRDVRGPWPSMGAEWYLADGSVEEANCSHCLEHFEAKERWHFLNELYRVLKPGAKATIITPAWSSCRAYGDMTHKWPPVSGFFWYYLDRAWRLANAPHNDEKFVPGGLNCNFQVTWGHSMHNDLISRNQEYQQHALTFWIEAAQDMISTLTAVK